VPKSCLCTSWFDSAALDVSFQYLYYCLFVVNLSRHYIHRLIQLAYYYYFVKIVHKVYKVITTQRKTKFDSRQTLNRRQRVIIELNKQHFKKRDYRMCYVVGILCLHV